MTTGRALELPGLDGVGPPARRRALPASRADKARAALAQRKAAASVTIEAALDAIHQATTPEALKAAGDLAAQLASDEEKGIARDAYTTRKAQLLAAPKVDAETGELLQPAFPAMQPAIATRTRPASVISWSGRRSESGAVEAAAPPIAENMQA
ncbi:hypothetical protein [Malikia spinosa]|uniref:Uncharacterized protein n=1 Tax=Malikia spinosa TaxID=86180 RepID=A0A7C9N3Q3_9BURK|nr:hypothetical protein [Malikia spinosa]MYZ53180.1 hypothetical protein [Malikia spinosa]